MTNLDDSNLIVNETETSDRAHLLVAIDYQPHSSQLLILANKLAKSLGGSLQAIYVETTHALSKKEEEQLNQNIHLAKQLEIRFRIITNYHVEKAILNFAIKENITHIIIGKPKILNLISHLRFIIFLHKIINWSRDIHIYTVSTDSSESRKGMIHSSSPSFTSNIKQYITTSSLVLITSLICYSSRSFYDYHVVSFCLLFLVSILAVFYGTGPVLTAAVLSAVILNFFFIPPLFTLHISKPENILMFMMFFIIALLNGVLTSRVRRQETRIRIREERTHALYQIARELSIATGPDNVTALVVTYLHKHFGIEFALLLKNEQEQLGFDSKNENRLKLGENEIMAAIWAFQKGVKTGKYSTILPDSALTFYPLIGNNSNVGVIAVEQHKKFTQGEEQFWEACMSQIAGKYEREFLRVAAQKAFELGESDKLYKTLFNSISHELRIPVATILGATDTLQSEQYPEETRQKLYNEIGIASLRLNRLIENLLNMSRLESGHISLRPDWCDVHDLANKLHETLNQELKNHKLTVIIAQEMPLVRVDFGILEHVLYNLILNATQYSPVKSRIRLKFSFNNGILIIQVMDRGKGFEVSELPLIFEKFYRGKYSRTGGTGLGLSIVKGFVEAHKGNITVMNRENGGAQFTIRIPCDSSEISEI